MSELRTLPDEDARLAEGADCPVEVDYDIYAGIAMSEFLKGLQNGEFIGARAPGGKLTYVPPVGVCPVTQRATSESVPLSSTGTLITYIIVHIPVRDKSIPLPYACGDILLDGAETPFLGLIRGIDPSEVRRGMRLRAVLLEPEDRPMDTSAISHFEPIEEPDVDVEAMVAERRERVAAEYRDAGVRSRAGNEEEDDA